MFEDIIVKEVRDTRERIAKECNYDISIYVDRMKKEEELLKSQGWEVVSEVHQEKEAVMV